MINARGLTRPSMRVTTVLHLWCMDAANFLFCVTGMWQDPEASEFPDEYQSKYRSRLLAEIEHLSEFGEPARNYDYLTGGIWEFNISTLRVTFFDTPGDGTYSPKVGERTVAKGARRFHFPEEFDEFVRLGHYFGKDTPKTRQEDISRALMTREEDLAHDHD